MKTRDFRIILFAAFVATILFSGVCTSKNYARPLLDERISLTKTGSPPTYSEIGQQITYSFLVTNLDPVPNEPSPGDPRIRDIEILDYVIGNISCPGKTLYAGESMTCTGIYTISQADVDRGEFNNVASLGGTYEEDDPNYNCCGGGRERHETKVFASDEFKITLAKPEIQLKKTGSPNVFKGAGEQITYTYSIFNTGTIALAGPALVQDNMVAVTCPPVGLAPGEKVDCTATYTTTEDDVARGSIINTALASVGGTNSQESSFQIELDPSAESAKLSLIKSTDPAFHSYKGELIIYIFDVTNTGSVPLTSPFTINDPKLDELICTPPEQLSMGRSFECRGYYRVREFDIGKTINNCASVSGTYQGQSISSEEACANIPYDSSGEPPPAPDSDPDPAPEPDPDSDDD